MKNPNKGYDLAIPHPHCGNVKPFYVNRNEKHISILMSARKRGRTIVVWSAGGYEWAKVVVEALELTEHVDYIMSKPVEYIDDVHMKNWPVANIYQR